MVVGVFLSADQHVQVRVLDGKESFNIDLPAINATTSGRARYYEHVRSVQAYGDAANAELKTITERANKEIASMNNSFLGVPVKIETPEDAPIEAVMVSA